MPASVPNEPIYYNSTYRHGVDDKRRVQIPSKWRPPAGTEIELTLIVWPKDPLPEACLLVLPPDEWATLLQKMKAMPFADPKAAALRRLIGTKSDRVPLDKSGRICIPDWMAKAAAIEKDAVLVGLLDRFEIWNPERWEVARVQDQALAPEAFQLI